MDAVEYLKARERYWKSGNIGMTTRMEKENPERAVYGIEVWAELHPVKTMLSDFLEKYPEAPLDPDGTPNFCPVDLGYVEEREMDVCDSRCAECWNRPLEEEK